MRYTISLLRLLYLGIHLALAADTTISPPVLAPSYASANVPRNLISFGIAAHSFEQYAVQRSPNGPAPNTLTINLLASLTNSTGTAPLLRVGGTSGDRATFVLNSEQQATIKIVRKKGLNLPANITLNERWFTQNFHDRWPQGTKFIFDVPLVRNDSLALNNSVRGATWALDAITLARFQAFEIGNEPNLYHGQRFRPKAYSLGRYIDEWRRHAVALRRRVLEPKGVTGPRKFQGLTFSRFDSWSVANALNNHNLTDGDFLQSVAEHDYPNSERTKNSSLADSLMNHAAVVGNLSLARPAIHAAMTRNIEFVNGEVGANIPGPGDLELEHTLGSALWTVDYSLHSAAINVSRIHMQQAQGFAFAAWWPQNTKSPPAARGVRANWYGLKFVAEALGRGSGALRVAPLDRVTSGGGNTTPDGRQQLVGYGIYESGRLARVVLLNLRIWFAGQAASGGRPNVTAALRVGGGYGAARVRVLTAENGAREHRALAFGGVRWDDGGLPSGEWAAQQVQVHDGAIGVQLRASEAALVELVPNATKHRELNVR